MLESVCKRTGKVSVTAEGESSLHLKAPQNPSACKSSVPNEASPSSQPRQPSPKAASHFITEPVEA